MKNTAQSTDILNFSRLGLKPNIAKIFETDIYRIVGEIKKLMEHFIHVISTNVSVDDYALI